MGKIYLLSFFSHFLALSQGGKRLMAGVNGDRKGKKDDNGLGTAIDFVLSNAKLVLGVGGAAMLGIATLAVKRVSTGTSCDAL